MEIGALAPLVATARLARVGTTGDYGAFARMGTEKAATFASAATGMMFASAAAFTKSALVIANAWSPWGGGSAHERVSRIQSTLADASTDVMRSALKPIRKRVVANSKRPGR